MKHGRWCIPSPLMMSLPKWFVLLLVILLAGCASDSPTPAKSRESEVYTSVGGGDWKSTPGSEPEEPGLTEGAEPGLKELHRLIGQQNEEIASLRRLLDQQSRQSGERMQKLEANLDLHLELLGLYYQKLTAMQEGKEVPAVVAPNAPASVNGRVALPLGGQAAPVGGLRVSLLQDKASAIWEEAGEDRSLYTTPLRNPESLLQNLDPAEADKPSGAAGSDNLPSNSRVRKFETTTPGSLALAQALSSVDGRFLISAVPTGNHLIYARANTATYTVAWLIPILVRPGAIHEIELNADNALVFLNDIAE